MVATLLLQLRVLRLGFFQDGDAGVGVFPESEEVLISGCGLGRVTGHGVGAADLQMRQRTYDVVLDNARMIEDFLEFDGSGRSLVGIQKRQSANIEVKQRRRQLRKGEFIRARRFECSYRVVAAPRFAGLEGSNRAN